MSDVTALLFFEANKPLREDKDHLVDEDLAFPFNPEEVISYMCSLHVRLFGEDTKENIEFDASYEEGINEEDLLLSVGKALDFIASHNAYRIYTVHAKSVLLSCYYRYLIRYFKPAQINSAFTAVKSRTIDLCESFHTPAILTLPERQSFSPLLIERWLGLKTRQHVIDADFVQTTDIALTALCQRLP